MGEEDCNIGLALCIGRGGGEEFTLSGGHHAKAKVKVKVKPPVQFDLLFPLKVEEGKEEVQSKKKLRLTKDQSSVLEDCFRTQHTLSPAQKYGIARQLNLRPRQVEVWFQNRRARTKLKQTEVDCEFLKRCCERLTDENQRLKRELMEVRLEIQKTAMITVCPRCEEKAMDEVKSAKDWRMNMNPSKEYKLCL